MKSKLSLLTCIIVLFSTSLLAQREYSADQVEQILARDVRELQDLKAKMISFRAFFYGLNTRNVNIYKRILLRRFRREILQGEEQIKQMSCYGKEAIRAKENRIRRQKRIVRELSNYTFSFRDGDIPRARAKKKLIDQFVWLVEEDLKATKKYFANS